MVKVTAFEQRVSEEGKEFYTLTVQGGIEMVVSKNGKLYMTARKMSIPSTFDEQGCQLILGKELPGEIIKIDCEPYSYVNKSTGEEIMLTHTYKYVSEEEQKEELSSFPEALTFTVPEEGVNA
jgi:hypothetical protein